MAKSTKNINIKKRVKIGMFKKNKKISVQRYNDLIKTELDYEENSLTLAIVSNTLQRTLNYFINDENKATYLCSVLAESNLDEQKDRIAMEFLFRELLPNGVMENTKPEINKKFNESKEALRKSPMSIGDSLLEISKLLEQIDKNYVQASYLEFETMQSQEFQDLLSDATNRVKSLNNLIKERNYGI
jgi:hypothetical protein